MGKRLLTFGALSQVPSNGWLNPVQDIGLHARSHDTNNTVSTTAARGIDELVINTNNSVSSGTLLLLDASMDWRDRIVEGAMFRLGATTVLGQSADYNYYESTTTGGLNVGDKPRFFGFLGNGARANLTSGTAVSAGNPPLSGAGVFRSYRVPIINAAADNVFLYADPTTGALYVYNASGAGFFLGGVLRGTGKTGMRP